MDNQNALRNEGETNSQIDLDNAWVSTGWAIRFFDFFTAFTEVNVYLEMIFFKNEETFMY